MTNAKNIIEAGQPLAKASDALIMLHGRGATAHSILSLRNEFSLDGFYVVAPQATNSTWYPHSFLAPVEENEPWLTAAVDLLGDIVHTINKAGIPSERIFLLGFSQGACLALEFSTRNARRWGGVIAFTGGLIGDEIYSGNYSGNFKGAKVFIGNSDRDPHVPLRRSEESARLMERLGATTTVKVYLNMPHTIIADEIETVRGMFFEVRSSIPKSLLR